MAEFVKEYTPLSKGEEKTDIEVRIGGRIYGKVSGVRRTHGSTWC